jgi:hypothetical protein
MVGLLCGMQSVQTLQPQQVAALLAAAVRQAKSPKSVLLLCKLPGALKMAAAATAELVDDAHVALNEICEVVQKQKVCKFSGTRRMMISAPVMAKQQVPLRVQLGMQVLAALQELQAAEAPCMMHAG